MSNRGEFRSWFNAIIDDPDFQSLDGDAFKLLFVLKASFKAAGIGIIRKLVLMEQLQCDGPELERLFQILVTVKAGNDYGWVVREGNIAWVVNGLKFETSMSPKAAHHQKAILNTITPLGDDKKIVRAFRSRYPAWFQLAEPRTDAATIDSAESVGEGSAEGKRTVSDKQQTANLELDTNQSISKTRARPEIIRSLITAMNQGMSVNPETPQFSPVVLTHGSSVQAATDILAAGVPEEFARQEIHEKSRAYRPSGRSKQINTLAYLAPAVIEAWEKEQANTEASSARRPADSPRRTSRGRAKAAPVYTPTTEDVKWQQ